MSGYKRMKGKKRGNAEKRGEGKRWKARGPRQAGAAQEKLFFSLTGRRESAKNNLFSCRTAGKRGIEHSAAETPEENRMKEWEREGNAWGVNPHLGGVRILLSLTSSSTCQKLGPGLHCCSTCSHSHWQTFKVEIMRHFKRFQCVEPLDDAVV